MRSVVSAKDERAFDGWCWKPKKAALDRYSFRAAFCTDADAPRPKLLKDDDTGRWVRVRILEVPEVEDGE